MLPPLLSLLLECAKKTDQTVISIFLGALVHLIEVGGHQFSDGDWETLLKSIRYFLKFCSYKLVFIFHYLFMYYFLYHLPGMHRTQPSPLNCSIH